MTEEQSQQRAPLADEPSGGNAAELKVLTVNQLVAYNLARIRRGKGWTQQETAELLSERTKKKWTPASLSAAERSWETGRSRQFDANELVAFAMVFDVPVPYFFVPIKPTANEEIWYALSRIDDALPFPIAKRNELLDAAIPLRYPSSLVDQVNVLRMMDGLTWSPSARVERHSAEEAAYDEYMASQEDSHATEDAESTHGEEQKRDERASAETAELSFVVTESELRAAVEQAVRRAYEDVRLRLGVTDGEQMDKPPF